MTCTPQEKAGLSSTSLLGAGNFAAILPHAMSAGAVTLRVASVPCEPPVLRAPAGHDPDIGLRLRWQCPLSRKPAPHPPRTGIVGGSGESKIAKLLAQLAQKFGRLRQCLGRVERIAQQALGGRHRHKLRNALGLLTTACHGSYYIGSEPALLPDDASEELERKLIGRCGSLDHLADGLRAQSLSWGAPRLEPRYPRHRPAGSVDRGRVAAHSLSPQARATIPAPR